MTESLQESLSLIDDIFGIDQILTDHEADIVVPYYKQSFIGYAEMYNRWQCMHVPLHNSGDTDEQGYFRQAEAVAEHLTGAAGQRVLELGCGLGANTRHLAARFPDVDFIGIDLMAGHVKSANKSAHDLANASFRCASFEALPDDLGTFDVIFGVETLCYAADPDRMAARVASLLRPGGRVIVFDAHRKENFDSFPEDVVKATLLYEITTAVTRGFHTDGTWERAFTNAGLNIDVSDDITQNTLIGLTSLNRRALKAYTAKKWRIALKVLPRYFARNTVAGLLGLYACFGDKDELNPEMGAVKYQKIVGRKQGA